MKIILDSGETLTHTDDQKASLLAFLAHPANQVPYWDPNKEISTSKPRWGSPDEWIVHHFAKLMEGVMATCPPATVTAIQAQIEALQAKQKEAMKPTSDKGGAEG